MLRQERDGRGKGAWHSQGVPNRHQPKAPTGDSVGARAVERRGGRHPGDGVQAFMAARVVHR
jgi:hypothetical protein